MNYIITPSNYKITLPKRGYFMKGDKGVGIALISSFLAINFLGYDYKTKVKVDDMLGDYFGKNLESWVRLFQQNNGLKVDGCIGSITLSKMREYGLNY
jgi:murein L,D-transpeptidase YcbB/YkuD